MVGPWIHALWSRGKRLSDIEYLSIKDHDGKRVDADATVTITNTTELDVVTKTASSGKDMWLGGASISWSRTVTAGTPRVVFQLYINGAVDERADFVDTALGKHGEYKFLIKGIKVAATQIIKITVDQTSSVSTLVDGKLILFEETTGESPQI